MIAKWVFFLVITYNIWYGNSFGKNSFKRTPTSRLKLYSHYNSGYDSIIAITNYRNSKTSTCNGCQSNNINKNQMPSRMGNRYMKLDDTVDYGPSENLIQLVKKMVFKKIVISPREKMQLVNELKSVIPNLQTSDLALVVWSLNHLKIGAKNKDTTEMYELLTKQFILHCSKTTMNGADFSTILENFAKLGIQLNSSSDLNRKSDIAITAESLRKLLPTFTESQLAYCLWAMGKVGGKWENYSFDVQNAIANRIEKYSRSMSAQCVALSIHGLSNQRSEWNVLPTLLTNALLDAIARTSNDMNYQDISQCISGLGRMHANWVRDFPVDIRGMLDAAILTNLAFLNAKSLAMLVNGLGRMGSKLGTMPFKLRNSLLKEILEAAPLANEHEITNFIYGLGRMGADFSEQNGSPVHIGYEIQKVLLEGVQRESPHLCAKGVINTLQGLVLLRVRFDGNHSEVHDPRQPSLHLSILPSLLSVLHREISRMNLYDTCTAFYCLGSLGLQWSRSDFPEKKKKHFLQVLDASVSSIDNAICIVKVLLAIGKMRVPSNQLPSSLRSKISDAIARVLRTADEHTLLLVLSSLVHSGGKWTDMGPLLQTSIQEGIARCYFERNSKKPISPPLDRPWNTITPHPIIPSGVGSEDGDREPYRTTTQLSSASITSAARLSQLPSAIAARLLLSISTSDGKGLDSKRQTSITSQQNSYMFDDKSKKAHHFEVLSICNKEDEEEADLLTPTQPPSLVDEIYPVTLRSSTTSSLPLPLWLTTLSRQPFTPYPYSQPSSSSQLKREPSSIHESSSSTLVVSALGMLGVSWEDIGLSARIALSRQLTSQLPDLSDEHSIVSCIFGIASMGAKWNELQSDMKQAILDSIVRVAPLMGEQGVSTTVLSLAKMEVCWSDHLPDAVKIAIRDAISSQSLLHEHSLSSLLFGLGRLGKKWIDLHPTVRQNLKASIVVCHLNDKCTAQGVANSLEGFAQMETQWKSLSTSVRLALLSDVEKVLPVANESQLSHILANLAKMGMQIDSFPTNLHESLTNRLIVQVKEMNEQLLSSVFHSMGLLGQTWFNLPTTLKDAMLKRFDAVCLTASQIDMLSGCLLLEDEDDFELIPQHVYLPLPSHAQLLGNEKTSFSAKAMSEWSLSDDWNTMNPSDASQMASVAAVAMVSSLKAKLPHRDKTGRPQGSAHPMREEGRTGVKPSTRSNKKSRVRSGEEDLLRQSCTVMKAQSLCHTLIGLQKMGGHWSVLIAATVHSIEGELLRLLPSMKLKQLATCLGSLSESQWRWDNFPPSIQSAMRSSLLKQVFLGEKILQPANGSSLTVGKSSDPKGVVVTYQYTNESLHHIASTFKALGRMGIPWTVFTSHSTATAIIVDDPTKSEVAIDPQFISKPFYNAMHECLRHAKEVVVSNTIFGMAMMGFSWDKMPRNLRKDAKSSLLRLYSPSPLIDSSSSSSSSSNSHPMTAVRSESREEGRKLSVSSIEAFSDTMYALSIMAFDSENHSLCQGLLQIHFALLNCLTRLEISDLSELQIERVFVYLEMLKSCFACQVNQKQQPGLRSSQGDGITIQKVLDLAERVTPRLRCDQSPSFFFEYQSNPTAISIGSTDNHHHPTHRMRQIVATDEGTLSFTETHGPDPLQLLSSLVDQHTPMMNQDQKTMTDLIKARVCDELKTVRPTQWTPSVLIVKNSLYDYSPFQSGVLPLLGATVYEDGNMNEPIAFIEIVPQKPSTLTAASPTATASEQGGGEGWTISRLDRLKEACYRSQFPNAIFARISSDQLIHPPTTP